MWPNQQFLPLSVFRFEASPAGSADALVWPPDPGPTSCRYSPEGVEGLFLELRVYVLRSSPRKFRISLEQVIASSDQYLRRCLLPPWPHLCGRVRGQVRGEVAL